jgi:hypothetical protein
VLPVLALAAWIAARRDPWPESVRLDTVNVVAIAWLARSRKGRIKAKGNFFIVGQVEA